MRSYLIETVCHEILLHSRRYPSTYCIVERWHFQIHITGFCCLYLLRPLPGLPVFLQRRVVYDIARQVLTNAVRICDLHIIQKAS